MHIKASFCHKRTTLPTALSCTSPSCWAHGRGSGAIPPAKDVLLGLTPFTVAAGLSGGQAATVLQLQQYTVAIPVSLFARPAPDDKILGTKANHVCLLGVRTAFDNVTLPYHAPEVETSKVRGPLPWKQ